MDHDKYIKMIKRKKRNIILARILILIIFIMAWELAVRFEMIDKSNYCVFYYNANYTPLKKRNSGTKIAYDYAVKKKKIIINLFSQN